MLRTTFASACTVLLFSTAAFGQVKLDRKFHEGASAVSETYTRIDQTLSIAGMDTETSNESRVKVKYTTGKRDVGGMLRVQEKIESLQISTSVMGMSYSFDSANPDNKGTSALEILRDVHKALAGRTTTTVFDKTNRVYAIESDQDILGKVPAELQPLVKSQLDPETLKKAANQELDRLTTEPVNKGDSWQRTESVNLGAGQLMAFQTKYTYEGTIDKGGKTLDQITSKTLSVTFSLEPDSPLPVKVKASDLKPSESESIMLFDRELGAVVETSGSVRIVGDITFTVNDMDLPSKLDLKMQSSTVVKR